MMALLTQKLAYVLAFTMCCIVLLIFSQQPWQKMQTKRRYIPPGQRDQFRGLHIQYGNQNQGKSTSRKDTGQEGMSSHKTTSISIDHGVNTFQGKKSKLTEYHQTTALDQPEDSTMNNPDDFWNMSYEERSKVRI